MPNAEPQFYLDTEVEAITRTRDPTRKRMEIRGLFPRRIRISPRRNGWRRGEIEMWVENPEDWPMRSSERADRPWANDLAGDL
jgi:predicted DNA-binding transcriptional regulator AlpA